MPASSSIRLVSSTKGTSSALPSAEPTVVLPAPRMPNNASERGRFLTSTKLIRESTRFSSSSEHSSSSVWISLRGCISSAIGKRDRNGRFSAIAMSFSLLIEMFPLPRSTSETNRTLSPERDARSDARSPKSSLCLRTLVPIVSRSSPLMFVFMCLVVTCALLTLPVLELYFQLHFSLA